MRLLREARVCDGAGMLNYFGMIKKKLILKLLLVMMNLASFFFFLSVLFLDEDVEVVGFSRWW